jgi:hypothetical protein
MESLSVRRDRQLGTERLTDPNRRLSDPEREEAILALEAGLCPLCGLGPFTVVAGHVASAHGVKSSDLRRAIGISQTRRICDPAHSRAQSARGKALQEELRKTDEAMAARRAVVDEARGASSDALIDFQRELLATVDRLDTDFIVELLTSAAMQAGIGCRLPELLGRCRETANTAREAAEADPEAVDWFPMFQQMRRTYTDSPGLLAFYSDGEWGEGVPLPTM